MAFLSSRMQETESKLLVPLGRGWNVGGLTDVETGAVSGLEDKFVCSFILAKDVIWGGVR